IWTVTFWCSAAIGIGTIVTDLWFLQKWPLPLHLADQRYWQFAFGILFLATVFMWLWFSFICPPKFGRFIPLNFTRQLYRYLLQGDEKDLPTIAAELQRSAWNIIKYTKPLPYREPPDHPGPPEEKLAIVNSCAHDILLLIGGRKFCRHIVSSAP